jgi:hypothetical protein
LIRQALTQCWVCQIEHLHLLAARTAWACLGAAWDDSNFPTVFLAMPDLAQMLASQIPERLARMMPGLATTLPETAALAPLQELAAWRFDPQV